MTKAQKLLEAIFGPPKSGFPEVALPTERDVVAFWMWHSEESGDKRGAKRKLGKDTVTVITNSLMVHWMVNSPEVQLVSEKKVKREVRDIIARAEPLRKFTRELENEEWISKQQKSFMSQSNASLYDENIAGNK